jgi:OOP family OmpA-OmpF porin
MKRLSLCFCLIAVAAPAFGQDTAGSLAAAPALAGLPSDATLSASAPQTTARLTLPIDAWRNDDVATANIEGEVVKSAWRIPQSRMSPLDLMSPIRADLLAQGYTTIFECAARDCGGFDFRYALPLLPEPQMHVDLADFQYFIGRKGADIVSLVTSRSSESGFIHLTKVRETSGYVQPTFETQAPVSNSSEAADQSQGDIAHALSALGRAALDDLVFASGSASLEPQDYASLERLADYLIASPDLRIALVGHTDMDGSLDANIALSKRRAEAVRDRLIERWNVPEAQLTAQGAGWLAPRATNATQEGRMQNRRVEAIITSTRS